LRAAPSPRCSSSSSASAATPRTKAPQGAAAATAGLELSGLGDLLAQSSLRWQSDHVKPTTSRVTAQGQVSLPAEIRKKLGLAPGALLQWEVKADEAIVRRVGRFSFEDVHRALFAKPPRFRSLDRLREGIRQRVTRGRSRR